MCLTCLQGCGPQIQAWKRTRRLPAPSFFTWYVSIYIDRYRHIHAYRQLTFSKILCLPPITITYPTFLGGYSEVLKEMQHLEFFSFLIYTPNLHHFMVQHLSLLHSSFTALVTASALGHRDCATLVYLWPSLTSPDNFYPF